MEEVEPYPEEYVQEFPGGVEGGGGCSKNSLYVWKVELISIGDRYVDRYRSSRVKLRTMGIIVVRKSSFVNRSSV